MCFFKGMEKDCLDMIFDHIKGKAKTSAYGEVPNWD